MKSVKLTVKGIVQKVGYRNIVYRAARIRSIKGYVRNLDDVEESVEIIAQFPDKRILEDFIKEIMVNDGFVEVHRIIREDTEEKEHLRFEVVRGSYEEENAERLDAAEIQLKRLTQTVISGNQQLGGNMSIGFTQLGDKIDTGFDNLGRKVDNVADKIDSFSAATTGRFDTVDKKYGKISNKLDKISGSLEKIVDVFETPKE